MVTGVPGVGATAVNFNVVNFKPAGVASGKGPPNWRSPDHSASPSFRLPLRVGNKKPLLPQA